MSWEVGKKYKWAYSWGEVLAGPSPDGEYAWRDERGALYVGSADDLDISPEPYVEPLKQTVWLNVYKTGGGRLLRTHEIYYTLKEAEQSADTPRLVGRIKVELVEGRFDDEEGKE